MDSTPHEHMSQGDRAASFKRESIPMEALIKICELPNIQLTFSGGNSNQSRDQIIIIQFAL